jgi:hypothetical protein
LAGQAVGSGLPAGRADHALAAEGRLSVSGGSTRANDTVTMSVATGAFASVADTEVVAVIPVRGPQRVMPAVMVVEVVAEVVEGAAVTTVNTCRPVADICPASISMAVVTDFCYDR